MNIDNITNQQYLEFTRSTAIYTKEKELEYLALGLCSESGEIAGKLKKVIRDSKELTTNIKGDVISELGDVLWYLTRLGDVMGVSLTELIQINHDKLADRKSRGVISGSGDNR